MLAKSQHASNQYSQDILIQHKHAYIAYTYSNNIKYFLGGLSQSIGQEPACKV